MPTLRSFWVGSSLSSINRISINSFIKHGNEYELFVYGPVADLPEGAALRDAREIMDEQEVFAYADGFGKGSFAACSNIFRYRLLSLRGGWWVDADVVCLKPFNEISEYLFVPEQQPREQIVGSYMIKTPADDPVMRYCLSNCSARKKNEIRWAEIGPMLLTEAVHHSGMQSFVASKDEYNPLNWIEFHDLFAPRGEVPECARVIHLWNQMWRHHGLDPDADYHQDCIYSRLKRLYLQ
jgi:mannosyltransferase OCH1-like enzyme